MSKVINDAFPDKTDYTGKIPAVTEYCDKAISKAMGDPLVQIGGGSGGGEDKKGGVVASIQPDKPVGV